MSALIVVAISVASWVGLVWWMKRKGHGVVRRHLLGPVFGSAVFVIFALLLIDAPLAPQPVQPQANAPSAQAQPSPQTVTTKSAAAAGKEPDQWADVVPANSPSASTPPEKTPPTKAEMEREVYAHRALDIALEVKKRMHDPSSFKLVQALSTPKGGVCLSFRGKNAMNALVLSEVAVDGKGSVSTKKALCGPKSGAVDVTFIRWSL